MKKYYCMFERKNHPFSWKLKPAKEEIVAYFKSRTDCINYYLSLRLEGSIWFQKSENDVAKGLIPRFEGTLKTVNINNTLIHAIYFHKSNKILNEKETLARLYKIWKIDPKTGEDKVFLKGKDRKDLILNSYLTFNEFNEFMKNKKLVEALQSNPKKPNVVKEVELVEEKPEILEVEKHNEPIMSIQVSIQEIKAVEEPEEQPLKDPPIEQIPLDEKNEEDKIEIVYSEEDQNSKIYEVALNKIFENSSLFETEYVDAFEDESFNLDDIDDFQNYNSKFSNHNSKYQNSYKKEILEYNNLGNSIFESQQINQYGDPYMQQKRFINNTGYVQHPDGTVEFTAVPNQTLNTAINPLGSETMIIATPQYTTNAIYQPATVYDTSLVQTPMAPSVVTEVTRTEYYTPGNVTTSFAYPQPYDYATQQVPIEQSVVSVPVYVPTPQANQQVAPEAYTNENEDNNSKKTNTYDTLEEDIKSIKQGIKKLKEDFRETTHLSFSNEKNAQEISTATPVKSTSTSVPTPAPAPTPTPTPYQPEPPKKQHAPIKPQSNSKPSRNPNQNHRSNMQKQSTKVAVKKKKDPLSIFLIVVAVLILVVTAIFLGLYFGTDIFKNIF